MSHQGNEGWYPECKVCGCGNLPVMVCEDCFRNASLKSLQEAQRGWAKERYESAQILQTMKGWFKECSVCHKVLYESNPFCQSHAYCGECAIKNHISVRYTRKK